MSDLSWHRALFVVMLALGPGVVEPSLSRKVSGYNGRAKEHGELSTSFETT